MKIKVNLSIGYVGAEYDDVIEIDDSVLEGLSPLARDEYIYDEVQEWGNQYIELWHEEITE